MFVSSCLFLFFCLFVWLFVCLSRLFVYLSVWLLALLFVSRCVWLYLFVCLWLLVPCIFYVFVSISAAGGYPPGPRKSTRNLKMSRLGPLEQVPAPKTDYENIFDQFWESFWKPFWAPAVICDNLLLHFGTFFCSIVFYMASSISWGGKCCSRTVNTASE